MAAGQDMKISSVRVTPEGSTYGEENVLQPAVGSQDKNDTETQGPWKVTRVCSRTAMRVSSCVVSTAFKRHLVIMVCLALASSSAFLCDCRSYRYGSLEAALDLGSGWLK